MTDKRVKYLLFPAVGLNLLLTLLALALSLFLTSLLCLVVLAATSGPPLTPATLEVINDSEATVCDVYISGVEYTDWGGDWLDSRLVPGESLMVDVAEGYYDILLVDCDQNVLVETYEVPVSGWQALYIDGLQASYPLRQAQHISPILQRLSSDFGPVLG